MMKIRRLSNQKRKARKYLRRQGQRNPVSNINLLLSRKVLRKAVVGENGEQQHHQSRRRT